MVFRSQDLGGMCVCYCGGCTSPRLSVDRTGNYLYICVDLHSHIDISVHKNTDLHKHFIFIFTSHCNMYVEICVCTDTSRSNPKPRVHFNFPYYVRIKIFYDCDRSDSICKAFCCFPYLAPWTLTPHVRLGLCLAQVLTPVPGRHHARSRLHPGLQIHMLGYPFLWTLPSGLPPSLDISPSHSSCRSPCQADLLILGCLPWG